MHWMVRWWLRRCANQIEDVIVRNLIANLRDQTPRIVQALDEEPTIEKFTFVGYDEGGVMIGPTGAHRVVCVTDSGAAVVVFGRESDMKNINAVLEAGLPCSARCETHPASRTARRIAGHTHWVWQHGMLEVVPSRPDEEILTLRANSI